MSLDLRSGRLTPSVLQRFAWARWLTVADAHWRTHHRGGEEFARAATRALDAEHGQSSQKRPGRRGHPDAHYRAVAQRYDQLRAQGNTAPTQTLARDHQVSRHTAAGWVRRARQLGYLPPGRPRRAG